MKSQFINLILLIIINHALAQNKPAYQLYNNQGELADYQSMVEELSNSDMVFFGEYHTNPISHWLQLELAKSLYEIRGKNLYLGAEMFENGNQLVIDEYLKGFYPEDKMLPEITQLWNNYKTDYKPLLEFAKENELRFIATNIPRRYASMINKMGWEALEVLSDEALAMIGPDLREHFDPNVKAYADMAEMMGDHKPPNMLYLQMAQAAKDATMAHFALKNYNPGNLLLHFQGSYHSNYDQGIIWWINKLQPGLAIKSVTTVTHSEWENMTVEEKKSISNYIIVVADDMTKTN